MSETPWQKTACILCECNCGLEVQVEGGHIRRLRGDKQHPVSEGYVCEKPARLDHYQNGPDRVLRPLRRRPDGSFEEIDWDTAIKEVAGRLARVRDTWGGASVFYYGGGGQGNHLCGAYAASTRRALGARYRSSALAQEKTGEFWVAHRMLGAQTRGDFERCEVALFLGKNPWQSHGLPRARATLRAIAKDPARTLIVVDPRRTRTAELADMHVQLTPGTDAWLLAAVVAVLLEEGLTDEAFLKAHAVGLSEVEAALGPVDVAAYAAWCGVAESQVRELARVLGRARSVASYEDLGVQMNRHSTLVSYLHRLVWLLTGQLGRPGAQYIPSVLAPIADGRSKRRSPVTGARIVGGLVPCNHIPEEILTDHPQRFRAMIVEASNPAHSLADAPRMEEALRALDTLVVIDVAMTETARLADYVLPASTQFEKAEATFFNFDFPRNAFHLRGALFAPPEGPLPEAEIHARLTEALVEPDAELIQELRDAAAQGLPAYAERFATRVVFDPALSVYAATLLYRTLGPSLPEGLAEGAVMLGLTLRAALQTPGPLARAGFTGTPIEAGVALFEAILSARSGVVFAEDRWESVLRRLGTPDGKVQLALDDLLAEARGLSVGPEPRDLAWPLVLSAGERRAFTANTIIRDAAWRRRDVEGALRIAPEDAAPLGLESGDQARLVTPRGEVVVTVEVSERMHRGHVSLPNGMGLRGDSAERGGVPTNALTELRSRDPFVGTPLHKRVPARLERL
ncbi:MAG: molybdopterin-dependent oxidoreductase [Alphaproteobacteria bacterium]|nr:molybdopterin-dependent oxidoreductase [Alphaproteobacteria bacterium]